MKNLQSCHQSANITSTFWSLKTDPSPPHFVEETVGGISKQPFNLDHLDFPTNHQVEGTCTITMQVCTHFWFAL